MKQDFIDRSYLNAQEDLRISSVKDGPVCVLNDSISELGFDKTLESQNDKFQTNKQKHAGDNLITNCLEQDYDVTKTVFMANSEILETQEEAAKVTECLQRYPVVLLTRLDTENFGQLFFDKICMNCVEINNNNSAKTTENFQTSSPDKIRFSENVTNDSHTFLPQKIKMEMISENALNTTDTNDIDPVCSPASSMDENDDQALPLVISEVRWNAKDIFYDNTPIKDNQSDNANYFNSNIVDSNIVEPFFSLLEAIESNNHTSSKVSQSSPSTKTASVPTSTMPLEGSLPSENVPMPETGCSVDKVSDSDFQFKDQIYESSVAKDNNSENSDQRLSPKLSGKKDLRNRRKCQRVVNYSDDSSLDCLLDSMDKAHKKNRRNKSKHMPPLMKEIRKKATAYSKCRKRAELGNSSGKNLDTGNKVSQKRTNSVLESLTTYENNLHENAVKPIKILFSDTNAEVNPDKTSKRKSEDKGDLKDTELSSSIMKSEKKASRMRAVFQKLEKEISFSLTATPSHKKTLPSDEESIDCIKVVSSLKETKPQSTSPVPSHMKQRDKRFSVDSHYLQKRPSPGLRREEKHRKRGNKVPSHCSSPGSDNSHDQQAGPSKKTKKKRGHINDDEAPLKRLARELPRFNWLEDKIKNSSQTSSVQLVKETRTEKSVITMDNGPILKNKVINNSQFDESIIGAAQNQTLYEKTCDITESTDCIFPGQNNFEKTVEMVENGSDCKDKNTRGQWQTFYKEMDVLPQTGSEKGSRNLSVNQLLPHDLSDQPVPSDHQKHEKSMISPPPSLYRHLRSPVSKVQQELTMDSMDPTNSNNLDKVFTKNAKDNSQAIVSTLDQDLQQITPSVHKDSGSSSSKFRPIRPKIDPILITRKPFFSFTNPTEAEYYIPKLAPEESHGFENLQKKGSMSIVCSVQDSVLEQGERADSQFESKDSSLTEDNTYERESHKLSYLRLDQHASNTSSLNPSSFKSIISFRSPNKIEGTVPTANDLTDYSNEKIKNDTKLDHTVSQDIVLSSERLVKTTDLDSHLYRDNSQGHLEEDICPSVTYDVVAQGSSRGSVALQQNEHTASHGLVNSNESKTPITSHDDISFKETIFSESKQKTNEQSSGFQVTKSSPLTQTLESKSSPKNNQSCKELSTPVESQGNKLTCQHISNQYRSEAMSGSHSRHINDFSQSNEELSACIEQQQFNEHWNVRDGKSKNIRKGSDVLFGHTEKQEDSDVLSEHTKKQEDSDVLSEHTKKQEDSDVLSGHMTKQEDSDILSGHMTKQEDYDVLSGHTKKPEYSDVPSGHTKKQEDSVAPLLHRTSNITSLSPKLPNISAHSNELKSQATQTSDENIKTLPISPNTSVEEIQHVISDNQVSRTNSINTPEKLANQNWKPLVNNTYHLRKEMSGHKENNIYKPQACRLQMDSLNSSNSAGYLSLKRKRLLNYAMDKEKEMSENQEDETTFGLEKIENSTDDERKYVPESSLKHQLHSEKIENAIDENEIQVIFECDKTKIIHQHNNDHFSKLASSDTQLASREIVERKTDKRENSQDKSVIYVGNLQNQSITKLTGNTDEAKGILITEPSVQKHRNKTRSVSMLSQTEFGLAESPNIPVNINDSLRRSTSPCFFLKKYETSAEKKQNEYSLVTEERHPFRTLKEEMQTRKKELVILDNLAKQREKEYKELLHTRKEKYKLLHMLEQCFPKLLDSSSQIEHGDNKPNKNEILITDKCSKETHRPFDKALDLHSDKAQEKTKKLDFNTESYSTETKYDVFNKGGSMNQHISGTDTRNDLIIPNAVGSSQESDSDKRVVNASNLSWSVRDLKTNGVYSHTLPSAAVNPLNSKPVPLIQTYASTASPQLVPPVSIGKDLKLVENNCLNASKWTQHEQISNGEKGKNPMEKKITSPSAVAAVTGNLLNLGAKQSPVSNLDHQAFYRNHMTSLSNLYSTYPRFQDNFIGEQKNTNCEVCERITGCPAGKHNSDVCFSRGYVQHQNSIKRHEHTNEKRSQKQTVFPTVRPNMFPHQTALNPLLVPPLSGFGGLNEPVLSFKQENTGKVRMPPENLHGLNNQNFVTSNQNFGSRMPVAEVTMKNCRSPDMSSLTRVRSMMSSNRSRMNVRPLIQQLPHQAVGHYGHVSRIMNPQALSTVTPLQSEWPQQQMMVNYPVSQSLECLPKNAKVMEKHHGVFNLNHQSQSSNPHCGFCGKKAVFMCSGCKQNWYCGEPCQVKHWPTHSRFCRNLNHCV